MGVEQDVPLPKVEEVTQEEVKKGVEEDWEEFGDALDALDELEVHEKNPEKAREMKEKGNRCFQAKDFDGAIKCYTVAIRLCPYELPPEPRARRRHRPAAGVDEPEDGSQGEGQKDSAEGGSEQEPQPQEEPFAEFKEELAVYYGNRAACYVSLERDKEAVEDCTAALRLKPNYIKAALRKAQACERLDKLEDALAEYKKVVEMDPSCRVAKDKIPGLERECAKRMEKLKEETLGKLKELGNSLLSNFGLSIDNFKMQQDPNTGSYSVSFQK